MDLLSWTAAAYILLLPSGYRLEAQSVEAVPGPGGLETVIETACTWKNGAGHSIVFHWWNPYPPRPGGPLVAARKATGAWAYAPAAFVETTVYQGSNARMTVAFQDRPEFKGYARIAATDLTLEALQGALAAATLWGTTPSESAKSGCAGMPTSRPRSAGATAQGTP